MRNIIFTIVFLLSLLPSWSADFSAPMRFRASAYLGQYVPRSERYFTDGMIDISVDMLELSFSQEYSISFLAGAAIWTGMGYQYEDIIFDPRDMHYSLAPGFRAMLGNYSLSFRWLHDCFHEVDRKTEPTVIWNIFKLGFSPASNVASIKRELMRKSSTKYIDFKPKVDWEISYGFMPRFRSIPWFQWKHTFTNEFDGELNVSFIRWKEFCLLASYKPKLWVHLGRTTSNSNYAELSLNYYGQYGSMAFFWGYNFTETQPIRPKNKMSFFGFRWEL